MIGDVHFYTNTNLFARLIQLRTHGAYNHVCVEIENGATIEAAYPVVRISTVGEPARTLSPHYPNAQKLTSALAWLSTKVGEHYDVYDIVANIVTFFWKDAPVFDMPIDYDCSKLATIFLLQAGYPFPADFPTNEKALALVSPNDLFRVLALSS